MRPPRSLRRTAGRSPFTAESAAIWWRRLGRLELAAKIDALLKLSVIASLLLASSGVAYYYVVYLPQRDSEQDRQSSLQKLRVYEQKRADQERSAAQQRETEQRRAEAKASAGLRYQSCVEDARTGHDTSWASACKRLADKVARDRADCLSMPNLPQGYCDAAYSTRDPTAHCTLPGEMAADLDAALSTARNRCLQERNAAMSNKFLGNP
jgi:hypothetical protein